MSKTHVTSEGKARGVLEVLEVCRASAWEVPETTCHRWGGGLQDENMLRKPQQKYKSWSLFAF